MNFESKVEKLSRTYNIKYSKAYDALLSTEIKIAIRRPIEYLVHKKEFDRTVYLITRKKLYSKISKS